jgi:hypothetical protein
MYNDPTNGIYSDDVKLQAKDFHLSQTSSSFFSQKILAVVSTMFIPMAFVSARVHHPVTRKWHLYIVLVCEFQIQKYVRFLSLHGSANS